MTKLLYIDPGLDGLNNHHSSIYLPIVRELLKKKFEITSIVNKAFSIKEYLGDNLIKAFSVNCDTNISKDPISGWITNYIKTSETFSKELSSNVNILDFDIVFCNSFNANLLYGFKKYLNNIKFSTKKSNTKIFVELPLPPGFKIEGDTLIPEYNEAYLYRHSICELNNYNLILGSFCKETSWAYEKCFNLKFYYFPIPRKFKANLNPKFISFLGAQRKNKGLEILPGIANRLAKTNHPVLIHDSPPGNPILKLLEDKNPKINYMPLLASEKKWEELIASSKIIVLPYNPNRYKYSYSSIFIEAVYNGIPCIVPNNTSMSSIYQEALLSEKLTFDKWSIESIFDTLEKAISNYSEISEKTINLSKTWKDKNSPEKFIDFLEDN